MLGKSYGGVAAAGRESTYGRQAIQLSKDLADYYKSRYPMLLTQGTRSRDSNLLTHALPVQVAAASSRKSPRLSAMHATETLREFRNPNINCWHQIDARRRSVTRLCGRVDLAACCFDQLFDLGMDLFGGLFPGTRFD